MKKDRVILTHTRHESFVRTSASEDRRCVANASSCSAAEIERAADYAREDVALRSSDWKVSSAR